MAKTSTTRAKADACDAVSGPFHHMAKELKALGMKKPTDTLSASKVVFINRILSDIRAFMAGEAEERYLDLLDDAALPQYSDAILILSQYEGALAGFRSRFTYYDHSAGGTAWRL